MIGHMVVDCLVSAFDFLACSLPCKPEGENCANCMDVGFSYVAWL